MMSDGLMKMWIALFAIALMFIASGTIVLSRTKLKGILKVATAFFAYLCVIVAGFLMVIVVFSGPTE